MENVLRIFSLGHYPPAIWFYLIQVQVWCPATPNSFVPTKSLPLIKTSELCLSNCLSRWSWALFLSDCLHLASRIGQFHCPISLVLSFFPGITQQFIWMAHDVCNLCTRQGSYHESYPSITNPSACSPNAWITLKKKPAHPLEDSPCYQKKKVYPPRIGFLLEKHPFRVLFSLVEKVLTSRKEDEAISSLQIHLQIILDLWLVA